MSEVQDLFQRIANNGFSRGSSNRGYSQVLFGMEEEDSTDPKAQMETFMKWMDAMEAQKSSQPVLSCDVCQGSHLSKLCAITCEPISYMHPTKSVRLSMESIRNELLGYSNTTTVDHGTSGVTLVLWRTMYE